ncbi:hypothetical protein MKW94_019276 [Papaver nudicaule]|uniref:ADF-H domain-containing protein n=1 Tax=Papaver nudicaule TaxID=74823 RepID=A0AA41V0P6_PAPNU|nr:hypothetical protein [Papaver nudicaule]
MTNAASVIDVHDDCKQRFLELKAKRTFCLVVYKIEEKDKQKLIIVEKIGKPEKSYDGFTAQLPADESPDTAKVMTKMICTSSKERFKRELDGIQVV